MVVRNKSSLYKGENTNTITKKIELIQYLKDIPREEKQMNYSNSLFVFSDVSSFATKKFIVIVFAF